MNDKQAVNADGKVNRKETLEKMGSPDCQAVGNIADVFEKYRHNAVAIK